MHDEKGGSLGMAGGCDSPDHLHFCPLPYFCLETGTSRDQPDHLHYHLSVLKIPLSLCSPTRQKNEFPTLPQTPASPKSPSRGILLPKPGQSQGLGQARRDRGAPAPCGTSAGTEPGEGDHPRPPGPRPTPAG